MSQPSKRSARPKTAALARNAAKVAARAARVNETRARELVALIRQKLGDAAAVFYDVGAALIELAQPKLVAAIGHRSFAALVRTELGFSIAKARQLMEVARGMKRSTALSLGFSRAVAVVKLAAATPEDDTPEQLVGGKVTVRGHRAPVRPKELSARAILRAAETERRSHRRGRTDEDDAAEARVERLLAKLRKKDPRATARVVIARPKGGAATRTLKLSVSLEAFEAVVG